MMSDEPEHQRILQQRCVHHITSLVIRNITITLPTSNPSDGHVQNGSFLYFTLHSNARSNKDALFKSAVVPYSPNPTWSSFVINNATCRKLTNVAVRLWIGSGNSYMPALQWEMSLKSLDCIGDSLDTNRITFNSNAVIFGIHKSYYACSSAAIQRVASQPPAHDFTNVKSSYSLPALRRFVATVSGTRRFKRDAAIALKNASSLQERTNKHFYCLERELEDVRRNIDRLRVLLGRERALLRREEASATVLTASNENKEKELAESGQRLDEDRVNGKRKRKAFLGSQLKLSQVSSQLAIRRHHLLKELNLIFPIVADEDPSPSSSPRKSSVQPLLPVYTIGGVRLPDSENFRQRDDHRTSIALGHTAQLLVMISHFLLLPLRYPIALKGSTSTIIDLITEKLNSDRERIFPLHVKGKKDRFLFNYAVFLLNKNVAHIRYSCGLGTSDIRRTLENIKLLLEERLGTRLNLSNQSHFSDSDDIISSPLNSADKDGGDRSRPPSYSSFVSATQNHPSFQRSDSVISNNVFQRMDSRSADLTQLRNQLLGLNENEGNVENTEGRKSANLVSKNSSKFLFEKASSRTGSNDSITLHTTFLTGLEPTSESPNKTRMSLAAAKADLFSKKANQRKEDRLILRNGSTSSSDPRFPGDRATTRVSSVDTDSSRSKSSTNSSEHADSIRKHLPDHSQIEPNHVFKNGDSASVVDDDMGAFISFSGQVTALDQSNDELDLC